jgi:sugar phosphate isomerase/epimerase
MQIHYVRELSRLARVFTSYPSPGASCDALWRGSVTCLRECALHAAEFGVTLGVQNHHDLAVHHESLAELLDEVGQPNCRAMFDAWALALQGADPTEAVRAMGPRIAHTTVADYVRLPRFRYDPGLINYVAETPAVRAVPLGEGFIDYRRFFGALREAGYAGYVAYEMCSPLRGGGGLENLDRCARRFLEYLAAL